MRILSRLYTYLYSPVGIPTMLIIFAVRQLFSVCIHKDGDTCYRYTTSNFTVYYTVYNIINKNCKKVWEKYTALPNAGSEPKKVSKYIAPFDTSGRCIVEPKYKNIY